MTSFEEIIKEMEENTFDLEHEDGSITILRIKDPKEFGIFCNALKKNHSLKMFLPTNHNLGPEEAKILAAGLEKNKGLLSLSLDDNAIGNIGAKAIVSALEKNQTLTCLSLRNNNLNNEGIIAISALLEKNQHLLCLDIAYNVLGSEGVKAIALLLEKNQVLTELNLEGTKLDSKGAQIILAALENNQRLTNLVLKKNNFKKNRVNIKTRVKKLLDDNKLINEVRLREAIISSLEHPFADTSGPIALLFCYAGCDGPHPSNRYKKMQVQKVSDANRKVAEI